MRAVTLRLRQSVFVLFVFLSGCTLPLVRLDARTHDLSKVDMTCDVLPDAALANQIRARFRISSACTCKGIELGVYDGGRALAEKTNYPVMLFPDESQDLRTQPFGRPQSGTQITLRANVTCLKDGKLGSAVSTCVIP